MIRISRLALMASCSLALTACATGKIQTPVLFQKSEKSQTQPTQTPTWAPITAKADGRVWPQTYSDVAQDPNVRFGTLSNGMRYALLKNATPTGQASLRLRIDAGSLMETDAQQGLAHFLEHMAFNGSKNVPEGEMVKILERHGLAFGADTNAYTAWTETVYKLDLPKTDDDTVDTSLMLMRETASELTLLQAAVDRERGIVLSEERARDSPGFQVYKRSIGFFLKDQLPAERLPIGKVEVLQTASRDLIADYYGKYYRPERAVLVAVGDFDLDAMEAKIKARFNDWTATAVAGADPKTGTVKKRGVETVLATQPGSSTSAEIGWMRPADLSADSRALRQADLTEQLGLAVLNRRLERIARSGNPAFIAAGVYVNNEFNAAESTKLYVNLPTEKWQDGLVAAQVEVRRATQFGVLQPELDREISEYRANLTAKAAQAATRRTPELANGLVGTVDDKEVFTNPAQDLAFFEDAIKTIDAAAASAEVKQAFSGEGPLVFLSTPTAVADGDKILAHTFQTAQTQPVTAPAAQIAKTWPYDSFGTPGVVVEQKDVPDLDTVFVRFANGVRLTVKPTKFSDDQILVRANLGHGMLDLPKDRGTAAWAAGGSFIEGGLKDLKSEEVEQILASKIYGAGLEMDEDALILSGKTRGADLNVQMQVLAAYVAEPGWRSEAFQRMKTYGATLNSQFDATASGVFRRDLAQLLRSGDQRWGFPSSDQIAAELPTDLRAAVEPSLTRGPLEVVVVGDITVEKAIDAVAATFGALPPRADQAPAQQASTIAFPAPIAQPVVLTHKGRADQSIGYVAWPTADFASNPQRARDLRILTEVLDLRLTDELREAQGATYSPSTDYEASLVYPGYGYIAASMETPPAKLTGFFKDVDKIAADLRDKPISQDELDRAKKPRIEALEKARQTNDYWLARLSGAQTDAGRLTLIRSAVSGPEHVTIADVQKAARTYLLPSKAWRLQVVAAPAK